MILVGDTVWNIEPGDIIYSKNRLLVDHFSLVHGEQHLIVSGLATPNRNDSMRGRTPPISASIPR